VKLRIIHYFQISISIFLLTACVGTLNVQLEKSENTLPVRATTVISSVVPSVTSKLDPTSTSESGSARPKSTDQSVTAGSAGFKNPVFNYDPSLASSTVVESRPAVLPSSNGPYWQTVPDRTQITLNDYPISESSFKPQIFIYPVDQYRQESETAGKVIDALQNLLKVKLSGPESTPVPGLKKQLPFLPLLDEQQMMQAQIRFFNFKNGQGVRYLTQFSQGFNPINNHDLVYSFQGLTEDGKYYLSAILPINASNLPSGASPIPGDNYDSYIAGIIQQLDSQQITDFNPVLSYLDDLMASFEIK
jgi:hypothetical protein